MATPQNKTNRKLLQTFASWHGSGKLLVIQERLATRNTVEPVADDVEVIEVRGLISSLKRSFSDKKGSLNVSEVLQQRFGKFFLIKTLLNRCNVLRCLN